jgi:DNA replication protein DnaC
MPGDPGQASRNGSGRACPFGKCDGSGWILGEDDLAYECECLAPRLTRARSAGVNSVIPPRYRGVSFDRPPITEIDSVVVNAVRDWVENIDVNLQQGRGIWLMGDTGTGKTSLAMLVSKEALKRDRTVAIYSLPKLFARIRATYDAGPEADSYTDFFESLCAVDLLHLEDLGTEKRTEWVLEQLYALINERYEREKSIMVTTNFDQGELEEQLGDRILSRLVEICGDPLPLYGTDHRLEFRPPES